MSHTEDGAGRGGSGEQREERKFLGGNHFGRFVSQSAINGADSTATGYWWARVKQHRCERDLM